MNRYVRLPSRRTCSVLAVAALLLVFTTAAAYAQAAGGGGLLAPIINWVATNLLQGLIEGGILLVGVLLLFSRHTMAGVAVMVIGAIVISQYANLAALVPVGAG